LKQDEGHAEVRLAMLMGLAFTSVQSFGNVSTFHTDSGTLKNGIDRTDYLNGGGWVKNGRKTINYC